jgi:hypothetical protein
MFTFIRAGDIVLIQNSDGVSVGSVRKESVELYVFYLDQQEQEALYELLGCKGHPTGEKEMLTSFRLWWEIVGVDKNGFYHAKPRLTTAPLLANRVSKEAVVEALLRTIPTLAGLTKETIESVYLSQFLERELNGVLYYHLRDLPTELGLVPLLDI